MKICVLGLGYIGLPTASMFAVNSHTVIGVDVDPRVVEELGNGRVHIHEPGLSAIVQAALNANQLTVSTQPEPADCFVISVPTPVVGRSERDGGSVTPRPDLSHVVAAAESIVPYLREGNLVILESTSPPGTTATTLRPILERSGLLVGENLQLAYCAERVLPGRIMLELVQNDRVIGGIDTPSAEAARDVYASFVEGEIFLTDATTAEMVKLMENTYRDVNIALANEFARVANAQGIDVVEAISLANRHPRVQILRPGPGVGGHCIAVDPWFIVDAAPDETSLIRSARSVNDSQPRIVADIVARAVKDVRDPVIAILGLAYKADVDDARESPAIEVVRLLYDRGLSLKLHDPLVPAARVQLPIVSNVDEALIGADVMVILTDHSQYRLMRPWSPGAAAMRRKRVIDTRSCLDAPLWRSHDFTVTGLSDHSREAAAQDPGTAGRPSQLSASK